MNFVACMYTISNSSIWGFLCRADFDITKGENVIIVMKKRLPDYIVKCLLAAGYNELDVIFYMNVYVICNWCLFCCNWYPLCCYYSTSVGTLSVNVVTNTLTGALSGTPSVITGMLVGTHSVDTSTNPVIDLQDSSIEYGKDSG